MSPLRQPLSAAFALCLAVLLTACPGAQVKGEGGLKAGEVNVVLRRIDVIKAGWDKMDVKVIVAIENGTGSDVDVAADASLALVGESTDEGDGTGGGADGEESEEDEEEGAEEETDEEASAPAPAALGGTRSSGAGRGTAKANAVSELPIFVTLSLPADPETLETVLGWKKARVHVSGKVKAGLTERTIAGERDVATPKLPKFRVKSAQVAKVDGGTAGEAFITLLLENPNTFGVVVDNVSWRVLIADKELRTKDDGGTSIPPSSVEEYNISIPLDDAAFPAKGELKALLKNKSIGYRVDCSFTAKGLKGSDLFSGDMKFP